jgi:16S rRNA (guanine(966)-N(2))-methyltransferase RsmD
LRIIAGKYRGRNLKSPPSLEVRPTSDRLRETLFNVLAPRIADSRFLDLCAGSGAIGIEALSRGAAHVTFVDQARRMCTLIKANLELCRIAEAQFSIVQADAERFLLRSSQKKTTPWDIVFFDPPYALDYLPMLQLFAANVAGLLTGNGLLIVEHHHKNSMPVEVGGIIRSRIIKQGDSALTFFKPLIVSPGTPKEAP